MPSSLANAWSIALTFIAVAALPSPAAAICFTVVDGNDRVVYQSLRPPLDVSRPISQEVARVYSPKHHLLMSGNGYCAGIDQPSGVYGAPLQGSAIDGNVSPALRLADAAANWVPGVSPAAGAGWVESAPPVRDRTR